MLATSFFEVSYLLISAMFSVILDSWHRSFRRAGVPGWPFRVARHRTHHRAGTDVGDPGPPSGSHTGMAGGDSAESVQRSRAQRIGSPAGAPGKISRGHRGLPQSPDHRPRHLRNSDEP